MATFVVAFAAVALLLVMFLVLWSCNVVAETYEVSPPTPLPSSSRFPWVSNKKWVAYFFGVYRSHVFGAAYPPWPNPTDRLLSNTQKGALDPVHALKLRQVNDLEKRCATAPGKCIASETAARIAAIWAQRYSPDIVRGMYANIDASLLPAPLPNI